MATPHDDAIRQGAFIAVLNMLAALTALMAALWADTRLEISQLEPPAIAALSELCAFNAVRATTGAQEHQGLAPIPPQPGKPVGIRPSLPDDATPRRLDSCELPASSSTLGERPIFNGWSFQGHLPDVAVFDRVSPAGMAQGNRATGRGDLKCDGTFPSLTTNNPLMAFLSGV